MAGAMIVIETARRSVIYGSRLHDIPVLDQGHVLEMSYGGRSGCSSGRRLLPKEALRRAAVLACISETHASLLNLKKPAT